MIKKATLTNYGTRLGGTRVHEKLNQRKLSNKSHPHSMVDKTQAFAMALNPDSTI